MRTASATTTTICLVAASMSLSPANLAFAGDKGKASGGCSNPYALAIYDDNGNLLVGGAVDQRNAQLIPLLGGDTLFAIFRSVDRNNDGALCFKLPDGWTSGNTDNRAGFYNLVDNKS
jgi:hypothetical protein